MESIKINKLEIEKIIKVGGIKRYGFTRMY